MEVSEWVGKEGLVVFGFFWVYFPNELCVLETWLVDAVFTFFIVYVYNVRNYGTPSMAFLYNWN